MRVRSGIIALIAVVLLLALFAVLQFHERAPRSVAAPPPPASVSRASRPATKRLSPDVVKSAGSAAAQICGAADFTLSTADPRALDDRVGALTAPVAVRWVSALQDSGDLRARAAGLLLEGKLTGGAPLRPVMQQTHDAIVQLAVGTTEPAVYAVALAMCGSHAGTPADPACRQISVQRWAQIDPGNAVPWLLLADDAQRRHDAADAASAFARAATATSVDDYSDSLYAFAAPELPPDVTPLQRAYLATEVIGVEAAMSTPHYGGAGRFCSVDAMRDGNVRQQCSALAELLVSKGSDLLDLSLGRLIGTRAGWTSERTDALALQRDALMEAINELSPSDASQTWSCAAVERLDAYLDQRVRVGEVAAANDLLERSGARIPDMAQKYRQFLDDIRHAGQTPQ